MQFTTSIVSIILATLPLIRANGCYSGGATFADYGTVDELLAARTAACNTLNGTYEAQASETYCAANGNQRINFSVKCNANSGTLTLSSDDCLAAMAIEMQACSHGSEQDHGSFHYVDDPNSGAC